MWQFWCSYWLQGAWLQDQAGPGRAWARAYLQLSGPQTRVPALRCGKSLHASEWFLASPQFKTIASCGIQRVQGLWAPGALWGCSGSVCVGHGVCCIVALFTSVGCSDNSAMLFSSGWPSCLLFWPSLRSKMKIMKRWWRLWERQWRSWYMILCSGKEVGVGL